MEKIIVLAALISAILAMAQFPDGLHKRYLASAKPMRWDRNFD
jgi:hypothetical protein